MSRPRYRQPDPHVSGASPPDIPADLLPRHVGLVMDGNGRWAQQRGLPRTKGHEAGEAALVDVVHGALELGLTTLSAYAFSTENWKRSPDEVRFLMGFNRDVIHHRRDELHDMGVRIRWAGRRPRLWRSVIDELEQIIRRTGRDRGRGGRHRLGCGGRAATRGQDQRAVRRRPALLSRPPRRRPVPAVVGGAAHQQLPPLADRLRRARLHRCVVAGRRSSSPVGGGGAVRRS